MGHSFQEFHKHLPVPWIGGHWKWGHWKRRHVFLFWHWNLNFSRSEIIAFILFYFIYLFIYFNFIYLFILPIYRWDSDYLDIVAGGLQGDTLAPYLFIICLDYGLRKSIYLMKENRFTQTKERSRRYPAQTITDADYADDIALRANTPTQAQSLLYSLE